MTTVNRDSLRDDFDGYMADIDSLRTEGEITEKAAETITGLCDMMKLVMVVFLEKSTKKTSKKTSKNSSIPPSQTDKDETKKPLEKTTTRARKKTRRQAGTSRRLLLRKPPPSRFVTVAAPIFRTLSHRLVKSVFCTISVTRLKN